MILTVMKPTAVHAAAIRCTLPVHAPDDDGPAADFPGRVGGIVTIVLDLDTATVRGWPAGRSEVLYDKVRDGGTYELLNTMDQPLASIECDSVPACIPSQYGDYVTMQIGPDGRVFDAEHGNRPWQPDADAVRAAFFRGAR